MYDVIIVGGGPAAAAAAVYALGKQLDFLVIYAELGKAGRVQHLAGQHEAEPLPGAEAVRLFEREVSANTGRTMHDRVTEIAKTSGVFRVDTQFHGILESAAVIVATGATPIALKVPGANELLGYGLGYSIATHATLAQGKRVAVVGTTVRALRGVAELARVADAIYLVATDASELRTPLATAARRYENVEILEGYAVAELVGTRNVERLVLARDGATRQLAVDAVFVDLGLVPNSAMVRRIAQIDAEGFIWVDERNATTVPGLFAAGDVTTAFGEQILIAIGDGARAALSAYDYLLTRPPVYQTVPMD
jgi:thioredoxin reductase